MSGYYGDPMVPFGDALAAWLRREGLTRRVQQHEIIEQWADLVGPEIAKVTRPEAISADGLLRVRVASAAWATELGYMLPTLLTRLNAGRSGRVREIRWIVGPLEGAGVSTGTEGR